MPSQSPSQSALPKGQGQEDEPSQVCLTRAEWEEIADCLFALNAAISKCQELERDGPLELVRSVQMRFDAAIAAVEQRIFGD